MESHLIKSKEQRDGQLINQIYEAILPIKIILVIQEIAEISACGHLYNQYKVYIDID